MKDIYVNVLGGTSAVTTYVPVPCRGVVKGAIAVANKNTSSDTVTIKQATHSVCAITLNNTAGTSASGAMDSTYGDSVFDPDSSTATDKVLKIEVSALASASTGVNVWIQYDESAAIAQSPSEA